MKTNSLKVTAAVLAALMAAGGTFSAIADAPTAGVTSYTSSVISTAALPTEGFASEMMQVAIDSQQVADVAASNPDAIANDYNLSTSPYADYAVANVEDFVYVRSEASAESDWVGKLHANCVVQVIAETADGWVHIQSGNCEGYISGEYLITGDPAAVEAVARRVAVVGVDGLNVRKAATTESGLLGQVGLNDDLTVIDESIEGWVKVSIEEGDGFVSTDYVTVGTEFKYAETKEEEADRIAKEEAAKKAAEEAAKKAAERKKQSSSSSNSSSGASYNAPSGSGGQSVVDYARQFIGNPYRYGGSSLTSGTDCSGFTMSVYSAFGVSLPHSSSSQRSCGYAVDGLENAQPGDLICYSGHVGIYAGNGNIVHASTWGVGITESSATSNRILAIRRIF